MFCLSISLLLCCHFVIQTTGYFTEIDPVPTFSDWAIWPYTIVTYGRVIHKVTGGHIVSNPSRNLVPSGDQVEHFKSFLKSSDVYADKSGFITEVLNDPNRVIRILRPGGWGKTMNLNMLEKFLEIEVDDKGDRLDEKSKQNRNLFCGSKDKRLKVCDDKNTISALGKHPVISISLRGIRGNSYREIEIGIRERLTTAFQKHYYLKKYLEPNETLLPWTAMKDRLLSLMEGDPHTIDMLCSIQSLSEILYKHHGNNSLVYLLIDDYDSPIVNGYAAFGHNKTEFAELSEFMQGFLSMGINDNEFLQKVILTSTYRFYLDDEFAGLANITEYNLLEDDKYSKHFGLSREEVQLMLQKKSISSPIDEVQNWYGGYGGPLQGMSNPASVTQFIRNKGKFGLYSVPKANESSFVSEILSNSEVKSALKTALDNPITVKGDETDMEIDPVENYTSKSIVLLCNGIFTPISIDLTKEVLQLKLPNEEVKQFVKKVLA